MCGPNGPVGTMRYGPVLIGMISAALFGFATPLSKILLASLSQFQLAGLLYLGAGLIMLPFVMLQRQKSKRKRVAGRNALRLGAAVLFGGCLDNFNSSPHTKTKAELTSFLNFHFSFCH